MPLPGSTVRRGRPAANSEIRGKMKITKLLKSLGINAGDLKSGDIIEAYVVDKIAAKLEPVNRGASPQSHRA